MSVWRVDGYKAILVDVGTKTSDDLVVVWRVLVCETNVFFLYSWFEECHGEKACCSVEGGGRMSTDLRDLIWGAS